MSKFFWLEDYTNSWNPPSPDQRVPSIPPPPRPLVAEPLLPRRIMPPTRFESLWLPVILSILGLLAYAYGMWRVS
jgi:hypothetical protein